MSLKNAKETIGNRTRDLSLRQIKIFNTGIAHVNGETERNGVWLPEDGDSCYKTG
jgi:hypothetical protein